MINVLQILSTPGTPEHAIIRYLDCETKPLKISEPEYYNTIQAFSYFEVLLQYLKAKTIDKVWIRKISGIYSLELQFKYIRFSFDVSNLYLVELFGTTEKLKVVYCSCKDNMARMAEYIIQAIDKSAADNTPLPPVIDVVPVVKLLTDNGFTVLHIGRLDPEKAVLTVLGTHRYVEVWADGDVSYFGAPCQNKNKFIASYLTVHKRSATTKKANKKRK